METLRQSTKQLDISVYSDEMYPPYSPPAMVEYFLEGRPLHYWKGESYPSELGFDWHPGQRINKILSAEKKVETYEGKQVTYDKLLIASGARLFAPLTGYGKPGIYNFKSLSAAESLLHQVCTAAASTSVIIGSGFIGIEVALLLRALGLDVTLIEQMNRVMSRMLDHETAAFVHQSLQDKGIQLRLKTRARAFWGDTRVEGVQLENDEVVTADVVVAATGVKPNIEFLVGSGIDTRWGIVVDDYLCTNVADIYAAGDVVETRERQGMERYVNANFPNAVEQGRVAARNILGEQVKYEGSERINSLKHLELPLAIAGKPEGKVLRLQQGESLRKVFLENGRIVGFHLINDIRRAGLFLTLMRQQIDVEAWQHLLVDPGFSMGYLTDIASLSY